MALFRRDRDPDPVPTPDEAFETGLLIGLTGSHVRGQAGSNMADRLLAWGRLQVYGEPPVGPAGKVAGKRAGSPPDGSRPGR